MMTTNLSKGLLKRLCTQIGITYTKELGQVVSAYHQAKVAESLHAAENRVTEYKNFLDTCLTIINMPTKPQPSDAEAKLKEIARLKLKCNQLIGLCKSASGYLFDADLVDESNLILDAVPDIEQALEKIGEC